MVMAGIFPDRNAKITKGSSSSFRRRLCDVSHIHGSNNQNKRRKSCRKNLSAFKRIGNIFQSGASSGNSSETAWFSTMPRNLDLQIGHRWIFPWTRRGVGRSWQRNLTKHNGVLRIKIISPQRIEHGREEADTDQTTRSTTIEVEERPKKGIGSSNNRSKFARPSVEDFRCSNFQ